MGSKNFLGSASRSSSYFTIKIILDINSLPGTTLNSFYTLPNIIVLIPFILLKWNKSKARLCDLYM